VLERGYTYTLAGDAETAEPDRLLRSADEARQTDRLVTVFSDGRVVSVPLREMPENDASSDRSTPPPPPSSPAAPRREGKPRKASNTAKHQPTLFGS